MDIFGTDLLQFTPRLRNWRLIFDRALVNHHSPIYPIYGLNTNFQTHLTYHPAKNMPKNGHFFGILVVYEMAYLGSQIGLYFMTYQHFAVKMG